MSTNLQLHAFSPFGANNGGWGSGWSQRHLEIFHLENGVEVIDINTFADFSPGFQDTNFAPPLGDGTADPSSPNAWSNTIWGDDVGEAFTLPAGDYGWRFVIDDNNAWPLDDSSFEIRDETGNTIILSVNMNGENPISGSGVEVAPGIYGIQGTFAVPAGAPALDAPSLDLLLNGADSEDPNGPEEGYDSYEAQTHSGRELNLAQLVASLDDDGAGADLVAAGLVTAVDSNGMPVFTQAYGYVHSLSIGHHSIEFTATSPDSPNLTTTAVFVIPVIDTAKPNSMTPPDDMTGDDAIDQNGATLFPAADATDIGYPSNTLTWTIQNAYTNEPHNVGDPIPAGNTGSFTYLYTVTDGSGNWDNFSWNVEVQSTMAAPTLDLLDPIGNVDFSGNGVLDSFEITSPAGCAIYLNQLVTSFDDGGNGDDLVASGDVNVVPPGGDPNYGLFQPGQPYTFPLGTTILDIIATSPVDPYLTTIIQYDLNVVDTVDPVITVSPDNMTIAEGDVVTFPIPAIIDVGTAYLFVQVIDANNTPLGDPTYGISIPSGAVGGHLYTYVAMDDYGNSASADFTVMVEAASAYSGFAVGDYPLVDIMDSLHIDDDGSTLDKVSSTQLKERLASLGGLAGCTPVEVGSYLPNGFISGIKEMSLTQALAAQIISQEEYDLAVGAFGMQASDLLPEVPLVMMMDSYKSQIAKLLDIEERLEFDDFSSVFEARSLTQKLLALEDMDVTRNVNIGGHAGSSGDVRILGSFPDGDGLDVTGPTAHMGVGSIDVQLTSQLGDGNDNATRADDLVDMSSNLTVVGTADLGTVTGPDQARLVHVSNSGEVLATISVDPDGTATERVAGYSVDIGGDLEVAAGTLTISDSQVAGSSLDQHANFDANLKIDNTLTLGSVAQPGSFDADVSTFDANVASKASVTSTYIESDTTHAIHIHAEHEGGSVVLHEGGGKISLDGNGSLEHQSVGYFPGSNSPDNQLVVGGAGLADALEALGGIDAWHPDANSNPYQILIKPDAPSAIEVWKLISYYDDAGDTSLTLGAILGTEIEIQPGSDFMNSVPAGITVTVSSWNGLSDLSSNGWIAGGESPSLVFIPYLEGDGVEVSGNLHAWGSSIEIDGDTTLGDDVNSDLVTMDSNLSVGGTSLLKKKFHAKDDVQMSGLLTIKDELGAPPVSTLRLTMSATSSNAWNNSGDIDGTGKELAIDLPDGTSLYFDDLDGDGYGSQDVAIGGQAGEFTVRYEGNGYAEGGKEAWCITDGGTAQWIGDENTGGWEIPSGIGTILASIDATWNGANGHGSETFDVVPGPSGGSDIDGDLAVHDDSSENSVFSSSVTAGEDASGKLTTVDLNAGLTVGTPQARVAVTLNDATGTYHSTGNAAESGLDVITSGLISVSSSDASDPDSIKIMATVGSIKIDADPGSGGNGLEIGGSVSMDSQVDAFGTVTLEAGPGDSSTIFKMRHNTYDGSGNITDSRDRVSITVADAVPKANVFISDTNITWAEALSSGDIDQAAYDAHILAGGPADATHHLEGGDLSVNGNLMIAGHLITSSGVFNSSPLQEVEITDNIFVLSYESEYLSFAEAFVHADHLQDSDDDPISADPHATIADALVQLVNTENVNRGATDWASLTDLERARTTEGQLIYTDPNDGDNLGGGVPVDIYGINRIEHGHDDASDALHIPRLTGAGISDGIQIDVQASPLPMSFQELISNPTSGYPGAMRRFQVTPYSNNVIDETNNASLTVAKLKDDDGRHKGLHLGDLGSAASPIGKMRVGQGSQGVQMLQMIIEAFRGSGGVVIESPKNEAAMAMEEFNRAGHRMAENTGNVFSDIASRASADGVDAGQLFIDALNNAMVEMGIFGFNPPNPAFVPDLSAYSQTTIATMTAEWLPIFAMPYSGPKLMAMEQKFRIYDEWSFDLGYAGGEINLSALLAVDEMLHIDNDLSIQGLHDDYNDDKLVVLQSDEDGAAYPAPSDFASLLDVGTQATHDYLDFYLDDNSLSGAGGTVTTVNNQQGMDDFIIDWDGSILTVSLAGNVNHDDLMAEVVTNGGPVTVSGTIDWVEAEGGGGTANISVIYDIQTSAATDQVRFLPRPEDLFVNIGMADPDLVTNLGNSEIILDGSKSLSFSTDGENRRVAGNAGGSFADATLRSHPGTPGGVFHDMRSTEGIMVTDSSGNGSKGHVYVAGDLEIRSDGGETIGLGYQGEVTKLFGDATVNQSVKIEQDILVSDPDSPPNTTGMHSLFMLFEAMAEGGDFMRLGTNNDLLGTGRAMANNPFAEIMITTLDEYDPADVKVGGNIAIDGTGSDLYSGMDIWFGSGDEGNMLASQTVFRMQDDITDGDLYQDADGPNQAYHGYILSPAAADLALLIRNGSDLLERLSWGEAKAAGYRTQAEQDALDPVPADGDPSGCSHVNLSKAVIAALEATAGMSHEEKLSQFFAKGSTVTLTTAVHNDDASAEGKKKLEVYLNGQRLPDSEYEIVPGSGSTAGKQFAFHRSLERRDVIIVDSKIPNPGA